MTVASPPHQGWLTSICVTMIGTAIVFAAAREHRWGRWGFAWYAIAAFGQYASIQSGALADLNLSATIDWPTLTWLAIPLVCVLLGSQVVPRGGAIGTGLLTLVLNLATWSFASWAVGWYADLQHLALRDFVELGFPIDMVLIPAIVFVFGVVVELLLRWRGASAWLLAGSGAAGVIAITWLLSSMGSEGVDLGGEDGGGHAGSILLTCVVEGLLAGVLGGATWRLGRALRASNATPPSSVARHDHPHQVAGDGCDAVRRRRAVDRRGTGRGLRSAGLRRAHRARPGGPLSGDGRVHGVAAARHAVVGFHVRTGRRNRRQVRHHHGDRSRRPRGRGSTVPASPQPRCVGP